MIKLPAACGRPSSIFYSFIIAQMILPNVTYFINPRSGLEIRTCMFANLLGRARTPPQDPVTLKLVCPVLGRGCAESLWEAIRGP
ncbi:hypothetical protein BO78DRAFT_90603 [Aspergillus sclerotiicarbonarius CBS 121057]|uniref:Uncharacterized protein n=1 Tax=Aspergillus sclerotiicarbonarius (strain CBS 121057 / IBT 28362) TaxID=1448318 RepID=A0A319EBP4_ASPSB|nr:hypothetical protein BO78DRAFT_90603 [Aspergillus sclerotiicarbonarius CBS 121057]